MTYPSQSSNQSNYVLVVAAPGSDVAHRLVEDLRQAGISVAQADTPEVAARAALTPTCIAVLTPTTWNHPAIVAAVMAQPARLIPVLAEPMPLPQGPWTAPPLVYDQNTARTIASNFSGTTPVPLPPFAASVPVPPYQPQAVPPQFQPYTPNNTTEYMPQGGMVNPPPMLTPIPQPRRRPILNGLLALLFIVVLIGVAIIIPRLGKGWGKLAVATATPNPSYTAVAPGPNCDKGKGKWDKTTSTNTTFTCQTDALEITQQAQASTYAEVFYNGNGTGTFPLSYSVGVTASLSSGSKFTGMGFEVHRQAGNGGQIFEATPATYWNVLHYGTANDTPVTLGVGFTDTPTQTMQLQVDVRGAVMTFTINNAVVTVITDGSYTTTDSIALVMLNGSSSSTATVRFTNFTYKPLPDSTISTTAAVATATAAATTTAMTPYTANVPGHGCDKGGAQWADPSIFGNGSTTATCQPTGLVVESSDIGHVRYYGKDGTFPLNYSVQVTADISKLDASACIFVNMRESTKGLYVSQVCADGTWELDALTTDGTTTVLKSGTMPKVPSYTVLMTVKGSTISLALNGKPTATATDATYTVTRVVGLGVITALKTTSIVTYSKFTFTPLA